MSAYRVSRANPEMVGLTLNEAADALRSELGLGAEVTTEDVWTGGGRLVVQANGLATDVMCKDRDGWPVDFAGAVAPTFRATLGLWDDDWTDEEIREAQALDA